MYTKANHVSEYKNLTPVAYLNGSISGSIYSHIVGNTSESNYTSLISESKCRCRGTCRTGIGCTCK